MLLGCTDVKVIRASRIRSSRRSPPKAGKQSLGNLTNHRVSRVVHIPHVIFDTLAHQRVHAQCIHTQIILEPADHLRSRMLNRLIHGPGVADREHVFPGFTSRPADTSPFSQRNRKLDIHRNFQSSASDFSLTLKRMAVADKEKRALHENRQGHRHTNAKSAIIHVAAVRPRRRSGDGLTSIWRNPETAQHRINRQHKMPEPGLRRHEHSRTLLGINMPLREDPLGRDRRELLQILRLQDTRCDRGAGHRAIPIRPDPIEPDFQSITRLSPCHEERPSLGIARCRDLTPARVPPTSVDRSGDHRIARFDTKDRRVRTDRGMKLDRVELVPRHKAPLARRPLSGIRPGT